MFYVIEDHNITLYIDNNVKNFLNNFIFKKNGKNADMKGMEKKDLFLLCLNVLKDWKVYTIAILTFSFVGIGNYTINYRKKPIRAKKQKAAPAPKPESAPSAEKPKEE